MNLKKMVTLRPIYLIPTLNINILPEKATELLRCVQLIISNYSYLPSEGEKALDQLFREKLPDLVQALSTLKHGTERILVRGFKLPGLSGKETPSELLSDELLVIADTMARFIGRISVRSKVNVPHLGAQPMMNFHLDQDPAHNHFSILAMASPCNADTIFTRMSVMLDQLSEEDLKHLSKPLLLKEYLTSLPVKAPLIIHESGGWMLHPDIDVNPFYLILDETEPEGVFKAFSAFKALLSNENAIVDKIRLERGDCVIFNNTLRQNSLFHGRAPFINKGVGRTFYGVFVGAKFGVED